MIIGANALIMRVISPPEPGALRTYADSVTTEPLARGVGVMVGVFVGVCVGVGVVLAVSVGVGVWEGSCIRVGRIIGVEVVASVACWVQAVNIRRIIHVVIVEAMW
jgi:hypothetical protein